MGWAGASRRAREARKGRAGWVCGVWCAACEGGVCVPRAACGVRCAARLLEALGDVGRQLVLLEEFANPHRLLLTLLDKVADEVTTG